MKYAKILFRFLLIALVVTLAVAGLGRTSSRVVDASFQPDSPKDSGEGVTDQIIIKYKATANMRGVHAAASPVRMSQLSAVAGVPLTYVREMSGNAYVLGLPAKLPISQVQTISDQLMTVDDVAYAEPDRILQHTLTPNDPQYINQWHYHDTWGINAPGAWDITTGSTNIVVAVIDTGITNHADLAGRTVAGYDFISDAQVANDGDARDSSPSDPGDWITSAESSSGYFQGCPVTNSSWHGSHVAGTIGASSNNDVGVTGINWVSKILPVRVLGKCGGYNSDIIDGMRWAAGLSVSGVPANANPAKVINMSLGGSGSCSSAQQTAINEIVAAGTVIVVAAGNSNSDASNFNPANCNNVITVAATNRNGYRASYSNYGSVVEISAPGGETSPTASNGVLSTLNTGTQGPLADAYVYYQGTSMATPHVTGVASLVLSVKPSLTPAQVLQVLQSTARAFPVGGTCNTSNCGAGIVNAAAAVSAVSSSDVSIVKHVISSDLAPGDPITFTLTIANNGISVAASVIVTDLVPSQVLNPAFASSLTITQTGAPSYVWNIGTLSVGQSGVITLYGQIDPGLASGFSFTNIATISDLQDNTPGNNSSSVIVGEHKVYLPLIRKDPTPYTTIVSENFEGAFPGVWTVGDNYPGYGTYYWGKRTCRPYAGSYSGWGIGGGTNGAATGCGSSYPINVDSWMIYGPFSLTGATAADLSYKLWLNSESSFDFVCRLASIDGTNFDGTCTSGSTAGWIDRVLDMKSVGSLGDLTGRPNVWIALEFYSDESYTYAEGGYVDNIVLRKCMAPSCTSTTSAKSDAGDSRIVEIHKTLTLPR
jgi:serine protease